MREFKTSILPAGVFLYPVPVVKELKYLIKCPSDNYAAILQKLFKAKVLSHPDNGLGHLKSLGLHTDQQTSIYEFTEGISLIQMPHRQEDPDRADKIESILTRKIWKLMNTFDELPARTDLRARFESQLSCSECQKLGIQELKDLIYGL